MFDVLKSVLNLFVFVFIGYILSKSRLIDKSHSKLLSALLVYVFLPSKTFMSLTQNFTVNYITNKYSLFISGFVLLLAFAVLSYPISKKLAKKPYEVWVYWYTFLVPNLSYFGYPMAESIYGSEGLTNLIVFCVPFTIFIYTVGICKLTKTKISFVNLFKQPIIFATFLGCLVGITGFDIPDGVKALLDSSGNCMTPISMILVGIVISEHKLISYFKTKIVYIISALRLIGIPVFVGLVMLPFAPDYLLLTAVLLTCMPCGFNTVIFGKLADEDCTLGAGFACVSTILSVFTIPAVIGIFERLI